MLPEGSKLFWTHERIEEFIARTASESAKQLKGPQGGETDLSAYILELARHYGFTADEVRREIGKWMEEARKDVTDFRKQGMVAFAEQNFRLAGENFRRSAEEKERQAAEQLRESAKDRELSGDSFYNALDFQKALKRIPDRPQVIDRLSRRPRGLGDQGLSGIHGRCPAALLEDREREIRAGTRVAGPDVRRHLEEAVQEYERLIDKNPRSSNPQDWAMTQNNLGNALRSLGERLGGAEGRGGWTRRRRRTARPSPSTPARTSPSSGPRPRTTWASR